MPQMVLSSAKATGLITDCVDTSGTPQEGRWDPRTLSPKSD